MSSIASPIAVLLLARPHEPEGIFGLPSNTDRKVMPPLGERLTELERWNLVNFLRDFFGPD